jgi:hypothetical protein
MVFFGNQESRKFFATREAMIFFGKTKKIENLAKKYQ